MENQGVKTTSIAGKVLATCSCFSSPWQVGGTSMSLINTHSPAAFYEAFLPKLARYLTKQLEYHYTPEHSSWLNVAEVEISVLTEQCLDRRLASQAIVASEVGVWESERNAVQATIDWRFTIPN